MEVRVRCVDSGAEVLLRVPERTVRMQVAQIKRETWRLLHDTSTEANGCLEGKIRERTSGENEESKQEGDDSEHVVAIQEERAMEASFIMFRGQILADVDDVNLFALAPSDFFVFVEEEDGADESDGKDAGHTSLGNATVAQGKKRKRVPCSAVHVEQLADMGFAVDVAMRALEQTGDDLAQAIALLTGDETGWSTRLSTAHPDGSDRLQAFVGQLMHIYPQLAPIEALLMKESFHELKRVASNDGFRALVMMKESFPSHWLDQMNENPAAVLTFLKSSVKSSDATHEHPQTHSSSAFPVTIDLTHHAQSITSTATVDQTAIARLVSMGFDSDLVVAIYESCGGNEEMAANMLLETLP